jgi:hypothetical protein
MLLVAAAILASPLLRTRAPVTITLHQGDAWSGHTLQAAAINVGVQPNARLIEANLAPAAVSCLGQLRALSVVEVFALHIWAVM